MSHRVNSYERRLQEIENMDVEIGRSLDWEFMEKIRMKDIFVHLLWRELTDEKGDTRFLCNPWDIALNIREPVYAELVQEFLFTFTFKEHSPRKGDFSSHHCIEFCLFGQWFSTTLTNFAIWLGLYTKRPTEKLEYGDYMAICDIEQPHDFSSTEALSQLGNGTYSKSDTKASSLIDPQHRLLHRMLVHTLRQRKSITEKVLESDLWLLGQLVDGTRFTNLPFVIATLFVNTVTPRDRDRSGLCGGQYITCLARILNLLTP